MKLIQADSNRVVEIPGLPGPTRRPVDIDPSQTGFAHLRSLRIYQFDAGSKIEGHAEEDEVFVIVLAGTIVFTVSDDGSETGPLTFHMSAAGSSTAPSVAYLPPHSAYRLISTTDSEVGYARATVEGDGRTAASFNSQVATGSHSTSILLEQTTWAQKLRLRIVQIDAGENEVVFSPTTGLNTSVEALVHFRAAGTDQIAEMGAPTGRTISIHGWETLALTGDERLDLRAAPRSSFLMLVISAGS